jgi:hypothetical protein
MSQKLTILSTAYFYDFEKRGHELILIDKSSLADGNTVMRRQRNSPHGLAIPYGIVRGARREKMMYKNCMLKIGGWFENDLNNSDLSRFFFRINHNQII